MDRHRKLSHLVAAIALTTILAGCSQLLHTAAEDAKKLVRADPLAEIAPPPGQPPGLPVMLPAPYAWPGQPQSQRAYVASIALDSMLKCQAFLDRTGLAIRGIDAGFDVMTTALSALGATFTPIATSHALAAAAAISSGTKTALDSDLYAKQTAWLIAQQIDSTYFTEMKAYIEELANKSDNIMSIPVEYLRINNIHRDCDIDRALAALATKSQIPATTPACSKTPIDPKVLKTSTVIVAPTDCTTYFIIAGPTPKTPDIISYVQMTPGAISKKKSIEEFLQIVNLPSK